jgi:fatty-acyl-CoA synthase
VSPAGIGTWPRRRKVKSGEHPAIIFRGQTTSYAQLADRVDRVAAALQQQGVGPGDRVAYLGANHPSFVEALFASALLGAIFVPLNTRLSIPELEYQLSDSGARILINNSALEPQASAASAQLPIVRFVVSDPDPSDPVTISSSAEDYELAIQQADASALVTPEVTLDDRAIVLYTSGTTGRPKGAVLTHGALTWNAFNVLVDYDIASTDRSLMISPLFHVASLGMGCLPVLLKGATLLLEERFVPADALRAIEQLKATTISGVPTTYQLMMEDSGWATTDISSLRLLTCGGSAVPDRVRDAFEQRGLAFSGGYGMTETSPGLTMLPPAHSRERAGSAGLAHFFTEYRIATDNIATENIATENDEYESGKPAGEEPAAGKAAGILNRGEIEVRGPNVFAE